MPTSALTNLDNHALLQALQECVQESRHVLRKLLVYLAEVEERRLHLEQGFSSMFVFCQNHLSFSESEAFKRLTVARAARRYPGLLACIASGSLHLTGASMLAPRLTAENQHELLARAQHKSKRELEILLAQMFPQPNAAATLRRLPRQQSNVALRKATTAGAGATSVATVMPPTATPMQAATAGPVQAATATGVAGIRTMTPATSASAYELRAPITVPHGAPITVTPAAELVPTAREQYRLRVTLDQGAYDQLLAAQALLRHRLPKGDLNAIVALALGRLVDELKHKKHALLGKKTRTKAHKSGDETGAPADADGYTASAPQRAQSEREAKVSTDANAGSVGIGPDLLAGVGGVAKSTNASSHAHPSHASRCAQAQASAESASSGAQAQACPARASSYAPSRACRALVSSCAPSHMSSAHPSDNLKRTRAIPRQIKREVFSRDGGQCAYVSPEGRRCSSRAFLEYHHIKPFARGGEHAVCNIALVCRAHNAFAAEQDFGRVHQERYRSRESRDKLGKPRSAVLDPR